MERNCPPPGQEGGHGLNADAFASVIISVSF